MNYLELFAGLGGWSYGLDRAGLICVGHVELNRYAQAVIAKRYPGLPIVGDIRALKGGEFGKVDLVCGSPPCQPFSHASHGAGKGKKDDRYLWPEMCRVIKLFGPRWVAIENVPSFYNLAFGDIKSDLEDLGFEVGQPLGIPACATGKDHIRQRGWVFGYSHSNSKPGLPLNGQAPFVPGEGSQPLGMGKPDGLPSRTNRARLKLLGNSLDPDIVTEIGLNILAVEASLGTGKP